MESGTRAPRREAEREGCLPLLGCGWEPGVTAAVDKEITCPVRVRAGEGELGCAEEGYLALTISTTRTITGKHTKPHPNSTLNSGAVSLAAATWAPDRRGTGR